MIRIVVSLIATGIFVAIQDTIAHHRNRDTWLRRWITWEWFWTCEGYEVRCGPFRWKLDGWHISKELGRLAAALALTADLKGWPVIPVALFWYLGSALVFHCFYNWIFLINEHKGSES